MKTIQKSLSHLQTTYSIDKISPKNQLLFIDIETTGFSAKTSDLYLIGCIYFENNSFQLIQWFAETNQDEVDVLSAFIDFSKKYSHLIHFNGNNFDLPFLVQKAKQYDITFDFSHFTGTDLYKRVTPYKNFLKLLNCKQKTIEIFLNISREDTFTGGELIQVYKDYVISPNTLSYETLLLHNANDMEGLVLLLPILAYSDLFQAGVKVLKVQANSYKDMNGDKKQELIMKLKFPTPLPVVVSYNYCNCYFTGFQKEGSLKIPIYEEELKYFYANYKEYYYLPAEDVAIHKSIATFVDKEHREKATKTNCYTRKEGCYLPQWDMLIKPYFKRSAKDKDLFFELTDAIKTERDLFHNYASHVLAQMG